MSRTPATLGLLLCEQIIVEEHTRNLTLVNCFTRRTGRSFPTEPIPFIVFALLTNGQGSTPLEVAVYGMDDFEEIYRRGTTVTFNSPVQIVRCVLRVGDCPFPSPGPYQVVLLSGEDILAQRLLIIDEAPAT